MVRVRTKLIFLILAIVLLSPLVHPQTTYYVDAAGGSDNNNGTLESQSWKTIRKVNQHLFAPGDRILLRRGQVWREELIVSSSGYPGSSIVYGAYGEGDKPKILGSVSRNSAADWTRGDGNLWYARSTEPVLNLIMDSERTTARMVLSRKDLNAQGRAWYDSKNHRIYIYSSANPAEFYNGSIECALNRGLITIPDKFHITIEDLDCRYTGASGIEASGHHITIGRTTVKFCGNNFSGHTHYDGRGILLRDTDSSLVYGNTVHKTFGGIFIGNHTGKRLVITIRDNTISGSVGRQTAADGIGFGGPRMADYSGSSVRRNEIFAFFHDGIDAFNAHNLLIVRNIIHDNASTDDSGECGVGIKLGGLKGNTPSRRNRAIGNLIYNLENCRYGNFGIASNGNTDGLIAYNIICNVKQGIRVPYLSTPGGNNNNNIYNNVLYNCSSRGIFIGRGINSQRKLMATVRNNICHSATIDFQCDRYSEVTGGWNCLMNDSSVTVSGVYTQSNQDLSRTDPLFTDADAMDFSLLPDSPCIDRGKDVNLKFDYLGNEIPAGSCVDIGAIEYILSSLLAVL